MCNLKIGFLNYTFLVYKTKKCRKMEYEKRKKEFVHIDYTHKNYIIKKNFNHNLISNKLELIFILILKNFQN